MIEKAKIFVEGLDHPECCAAHPDGSIWAGGEAGQIYKISADGSKTEEVANTGGFILGLTFSPGAKYLVICDLGKKCLWKLSLDNMKLDLIADKVPGHKINIPNFAVFDKNGNYYVSESGEFRQKKGKILKFDADGNGLIWSDELFEFANGMAMGPDEKHLYIVSSFLPGIERVVINEDGSPGKREVYCTLPKTVPDGCVFDENGNLYVSCYTPNTIYKVTPDRNVIEFIHDWDGHTLSNPTNTAFGGSNYDQLFVANLGRWHITQIDMGVKGLKLPSHL
ncbi:MAG: SMP-30/gluconolactonase/LRE family protein [Cyclobacteriaceae bacterium]